MDINARGFIIVVDCFIFLILNRASVVPELVETVIKSLDCWQEDCLDCWQEGLKCFEGRFAFIYFDDDTILIEKLIFATYRSA